MQTPLLINKFTQWIMRSRIHSAAAFAGFYLLLNLSFRIFLSIYSANEITSLASLLPAYLIGMLYDLVYIGYLLLFFVVVWTLMPKRLYEHTIGKFISSGILFGLIFTSLFVSLSEWFFWEEFTARFNFVAVDYLVYRHEVTDNINQSYPVIPLVLACILLALVILTVIRKTVGIHSEVKHTFKQRLATLGVYVLVVSISGFTLGQGLKEFTTNRTVNEIASNGSYQFFAAFRNNNLDYDRLYATLVENKAEKQFQDILKLSADNGFSAAHEITSTAPESAYNVMFVVLESFDATNMQRFGSQSSLTPNLDGLLASSINFSQLYATGSRTTRGLESLTLSIPPTPGRSIVKRPNQPPRYNLGSEFQNRGYTTSFFYGGRGYFDNMNAFFSTNGFNVIDQTDFNKQERGFENAWGMADEYVYDRALREADDLHKNGKKFFNYVLTTSNHRPFTFPENRIDLPQGRRASVVKYTDWAIGDFLKKAKTKTWFDNTVFVFVSDHCASSAGRKNLSVEKHHIPMIIHAPKIFGPKEFTQTMSQIDVAPTLLGLLNFNYQSQFFGRDVFNETDKPMFALISNYQYLGKYDDNGLTYLKPKKEVIFDSDPFSEDTNTEHSYTLEQVKEDKALQNVISYYQAANRVVEQELNRFEPVTKVKIRR